jgi:hypothetical protein
MRTANMVAHGNVLSPITEHGISPQLRQRMIEDMTSRAVASKTQQGYQRFLKRETGWRCGREEDAQLNASFLQPSNKAWACPSL